MTFSERMGLRAKRDTIQLTTMDNNLRMAIYNLLHDTFAASWTESGIVAGKGRRMARLVWTDFMHEQADVFRNELQRFAQVLHHLIFEKPWHEVYDLIEFLLNRSPLLFRPEALNEILEREMSGYRLRGDLVVPVSDSTELAAVDEAMTVSEPFSGARQHILAAVEKLSQRPEPDLRNAITEAISAVESAGRILANSPKATLADALKILEMQQRIHPSLKAAWLKLYGYTSDEDGLRHSMTEDPKIDFPTAKYMVVICAAFVNLLSARLPER